MLGSTSRLRESPCSTADIMVSDAMLESSASQGVFVEGKNSVTLNDVDLTADNNTKNSDKSDWYQAVMIYQSMSGDAAGGEGGNGGQGGQGGSGNAPGGNGPGDSLHGPGGSTPPNKPGSN